MKTCQSCNSPRVFSASGKTSDMFHINNGDDIVHDGYVPSDINLGGGDYFEIEICMECGTVQGTWPVSHSKIIEAVG